MNREILIGTLLGDAYIQKDKNKPKSYSLDWQQSNKEYAIWKAKQSGLIFSSKTYNRYDKRTKKEYEITHIHLTLDADSKQELYNLFYSPSKEVSEELLKLLTPLAIAIWFMDDGSLYYNGNNCHLTLAVNGFNENSKDLIIGYFKDKYNLNFKRTQKAIRLTSRKDCELFMKIVEQYIPECMKYKTLNESIKRYEGK